MFWTFALLGSLAFMFIQLGAYSVWTAILSIFLKIALLVIVCLGIALLWRKIFPKKGT